MAAGHFNRLADHDPYMSVPEMGMVYEGTPSESSTNSSLESHVGSRIYRAMPLDSTSNQGFGHLYGTMGYPNYPVYPTPYPMSPEGLAPLGMIPVELDIEGLYEDHDRRRKTGSAQPASSHVHSRRRAQNRASQRAFRDRKEKHMRELEQRLGELEGRHNDLSRSYASLQLEYKNVKQELERLHKEGSTESSSRDGEAREWESKGDVLDPILFDVSAFCYDQEQKLPQNE